MVKLDIDIDEYESVTVTPIIPDCIKSKSVDKVSLTDAEWDIVEELYCELVIEFVPRALSESAWVVRWEQDTVYVNDKFAPILAKRFAQRTDRSSDWGWHIAEAMIQNSDMPPLVMRVGQFEKV